MSSLTTTWIEIRGFRDTGLNSPGGTRHHAHDDTDTQRQPLSGGAFFMGKKSPRWETRAARNKQQNVK
ncbi:hypothetical protein DW524_08505 [Escherichia coli]|nr:hypothetical protein [Escherichia coli]EFO2000395.1 hypothetical protein [Escherichia coli]EFO3339131.1 hypothetical protein [Escherichia coli]